MNVHSLFTGAGGLDLGLERAGLRVVSQCEKDTWRRRVLEWHWPGVPCAADVREVAARRAERPVAGVVEGERDGADPGRGRARATDRDAGGLLCGGFPCQDLSVAGRRAGLGGDRSGLFFEFARIADELQPRWLLVENVPGLLSSADGRDFALVLSTLVDLGYGVAWRTLDARYFGVPQRRRRVFIVGHLGGDPEPALQALGQGGAGGLEAGACSWQNAPRGARGGADVAGPLTRRYGKGVNTTVDDGATIVSPTIRSHPRPGSNSDGSVVVNALDRQAGGPDDNSAQVGHLIAAPLTRGSASGPGVNQPGRRQEDDVNLVAGTLATTGPGGGWRIGADEAAARQIVAATTGVRRLTPVECERLMSWPDGWTAVDGPQTPDSRRYAACGDGVVSNVAEWIGRRMLAADR